MGKYALALAWALGVSVLWGMAAATTARALETDCLSVQPEAFDPPEGELMKRLNKKGRKFFEQSRAVRNSYDVESVYKHFVLKGHQLSQMDEEGYFHHTPGGCTAAATSAGQDRKPAAVKPKEGIRFYRYIKDCASQHTLQRQVIDTSGGYAKFKFGSTYEQHCVRDGNFDTYIVDSETKIE